MSNLNYQKINSRKNLASKPITKPSFTSFAPSTKHLYKSYSRNMKQLFERIGQEKLLIKNVFRHA